MAKPKNQTVVDIDVIGDFPRGFDKAIDAFHDAVPHALVAATVPDMVEKILRMINPEVVGAGNDGFFTLQAGPRPDVVIGRLRIHGHSNGNYVALSRFEEARRVVNTPDDLGQSLRKRALAATIFGIGEDEKYSLVGNDDELRKLAGKFAADGHVELHACFIAPGYSTDLAESKVSYDPYGKYLMQALARLWRIPVVGGSQKQNPTPGIEGVVSVAYPDGTYAHKDADWLRDLERQRRPDPEPGFFAPDAGAGPTAGMCKDDADFFVQTPRTSSLLSGPQGLNPAPGVQAATNQPSTSDGAGWFPVPSTSDISPDMSDDQQGAPRQPTALGIAPPPRPIDRNDEGFFASADADRFLDSGGSRTRNDPGAGVCRDDADFFTDETRDQTASVHPTHSSDPDSSWYGDNDSQSQAGHAHHRMWPSSKPDSPGFGDDETRSQVGHAGSPTPPPLAPDDPDDDVPDPPPWTSQPWRK